jgi:poly-beta-1,6-N-acetyl-D-glucosamine synthase
MVELSIGRQHATLQWEGIVPGVQPPQRDIRELRHARAQSITYVLITPARDEAENLSRLAGSVMSQTMRPTQWVIVDDGSKDSTTDVAVALASSHDWIETMVSPADAQSGGLSEGRRQGRDVTAFAAAIDVIQPTDVVVKLDADVSLENDFFERLVTKFAEDPRLGIASGTCYELDRGSWRARRSIKRHARGATRAYRWACLNDVLPLEAALGWDGIDEIRANARGWRTTAFPDVPFFHHRPLGQREGSPINAWAAQGRAAHFMGYRPLYLFARTVHRMRQTPAAIGLVVGYLDAAVKRRPRLEDEVVRRRLREEQRARHVLRFLRDVRRHRPASGRLGAS